MSNSSTSLNLLIHDANGQPQMIKVLQSMPPAGPVQLSPGTANTVFKVPGTPESAPQTPIYRTVKVTGIKTEQKFVQVPFQTLAKMQRRALEVQSQRHSGKSVQKKVKCSQPAPGSRVVQSTSSPSPPKQSAQVSSSMASNSASHVSPPILFHQHLTTRKRRDSNNEPLPEYTTKRRKNADKVGKGLRHFSMKVCEKVRSKVNTSYNEVADELVAEFAAGIHGSAESQQYDQKNIRRRVYDALNVLMAMNIISKEKKEIRWLGLPTNSLQECSALEKDKALKLERIQQKTQQLHDLILQQISFKSLVERNKTAEDRGVKPSPSSAIHLPFIVVNTSDKALIDCSISNDKTEYMFNFNKKFQIYDDIDILKRMGLLLGLDKGECTDENLKKAKSMVPKSLSYYLEQLGRSTHVEFSDLLQEESEDEDGADGEDGEEEEEEDLLEEVGYEGEGEAEGEGEYSDDSSSDVDVN